MYENFTFLYSKGIKKLKNLSCTKDDNNLKNQKAQVGTNAQGLERTYNIAYYNH